MTLELSIQNKPLPTVIVLGNGRDDVDLTCTQVQYTLDRAGVDCMVLAGNHVLPEAIRDVEAGGIAEPYPIEFSIVLPIYNEEGSIPALYRRLTAVMANLGESYELIFVDDGSRDRSLDLLSEMQGHDPDHVRVICLSRNFGHQQAISAGLDRACGRAVIVMDADLQDPPEVIPEFVEKWRKGFHVVYAIREKRKECILKRIAYRSFYLILRALSRVDIPLDAGDFCLMDRCAVDALVSLPERNRFVRGLRSWVGFRQTGLAYERDGRFAGESKYTFRKLVSLALDGLISFSYLPLRLATILGFIVSLLSISSAAYYFVRALVRGGSKPPGFATLVVLIFSLGGVQLITVGVIGEYIGRILDEVKHRPPFLVRKAIGFGLDESASLNKDMR